MDKDSVAIRGFREIYVVNKDGTVETMNRMGVRGNVIKGRLLATRLNSSGYPRVTLNIDGKPKEYFVHRLVATVFIPNPEKKAFVNHKDGNRKNASVKNLEWVTKSENEKDKYASGRVSTSVIAKKGEAHGCHKLTWDDIKYIRNNYIKGSKIFGQCALARMFNVTQANIYNIINNRNWVDEEYDKQLKNKQFSPVKELCLGDTNEV